jgi:ectoine hydroxylase-related dioxygenase (phytanoyl-CoA dioxygenase family)
MPKALGSTEIDQFRRDGYLPARPLISEHEARTLRQGLEAFEATLDGPLKGSNRFKSHLLFKGLADLIRSPGILDMVEDLIGPDLMVWSTDWWIKEARSPSFVSWHQDSQYWGLDTDRLVTVWVALSDSTHQSGCMRLLPGSHLGPDLPHVETYHQDNMLTRGQSIECIDESQAKNLEVPTGHAAMFAFRIAHASYPNRSDDRRIGYAIRYIPPDARQKLSDRDAAALVRGKDRFGYFEHEPKPSRDFDPVAVAFHHRTEEDRRRILYHGTGRDEHRT